jgi:hypothetical protein
MLRYTSLRENVTLYKPPRMKTETVLIYVGYTVMTVNVTCSWYIESEKEHTLLLLGGMHK